MRTLYRKSFRLIFNPTYCITLGTFIFVHIYIYFYICCIPAKSFRLVSGRALLPKGWYRFYIFFPTRRLHVPLKRNKKLGIYHVYWFSFMVFTFEIRLSAAIHLHVYLRIELCKFWYKNVYFVIRQQYASRIVRKPIFHYFRTISVHPKPTRTDFFMSKLE